MNREVGRLRDPAHEELRSTLRVVGPLVVLIGIFMVGYGVYDFGQRFGEHGRGPGKFWMCFLGIPILGFGAMITRFAFLGAAARYVAGETAPVVADTVNYVAHASRDVIRDAIGAVKDGLRDGDRDAVVCSSCHEENDARAKFCDQCGAPLASKATCSECGEENGPDARFCSACGDRLGLKHGPRSPA
jgi:hypothetical protein